MGSPSKDCDILWLVEHVARELDTACAIKAIIENNYDISIEIKNIYYHAEEILSSYRPKVVIHPFFYFVDGALATEDYVKMWPHATHLNLAWEQIHYKAHLEIKAPSDEFSQRSVIHHAWGDFYEKYLLDAGVPDNNIFVNGQPVYQLYKAPYRNYFSSRESLAAKYQLDATQRWIFIPENYRWAFIGDKAKLFTRLGMSEEVFNSLSDFCSRSLKKLLHWCNNIESNESTSIIFRPRPSVSLEKMQSFFNKHVGQKKKPHLRFIKEDTVRDWINTSDIIISSYSTSLIEAAIADKPIYMVEPVEFPETLFCSWYELAPRIKSDQAFKDVCSIDQVSTNSQPLKKWAQEEMLSKGDPIKKLASYIVGLVNNHANYPKRSANWKNEKKMYFNATTHENDIFDAVDINSRVSAWKKILNINLDENTSNPSVAIDDKNCTDTINKSMQRTDLFEPEAERTIIGLNDLIKLLYKQGIWMSSWVGTLPKVPIKNENIWDKLLHVLGLKSYLVNARKKCTTELNALERGMAQRLNYQPLPDAVDDVRFPWFLYWEIYWTLRVTRPYLHEGMRIFDGGGSASLFTCYLASLGFEIHCVELNESLNAHARRIAKAMNWSLFPYDMDMRKLDFPDNYFDHAFSICVFEHLDYDVKQSALAEIARCLKPGGILAITFDYRNPAPGVVGYGKDTRYRNQLKTESDIKRNFISTGHFELMGNSYFCDNGESYLFHERFDNTPYTFGAIFLRKA